MSDSFDNISLTLDLPDETPAAPEAPAAPVIEKKPEPEVPEGRPLGKGQEDD